MKKLATSALAALIIAGSSTFAHANPITGMWKTGDGVLVNVSKCGGQFCVDVADGKYKGKRSGTLKADGGNKYSGTLKQFSTGISFSGEATLTGSTMKLIAKKFGVTVKRDTWKKQ